MIQEFINRHFFNLFIFTFVFGLLLYGGIGFDYTDEICAFILLVLYCFAFFKNPQWEINKAFLITIGVFLFYLIYSFIIGSNVKQAIISDFIVQFKPYLALFCIYSLMPELSKNQKVKLKLFSVFAWYFLLIIGLLSLVFPDILVTTMGHNAYFAAGVVAVSLCYLFTSDFTQKDRIIFLIMLALGLISTRAKFYGFYALSVMCIIFFSNVKNIRITPKNILLLIVTLALILLVAKNKISLYFLDSLSIENEKDLIARFVLYATSFEIFRDYFPFGSGFGSFATFSSGVYYSNIYQEYGIEKVWGISKDFYSYIADTYYPSLAQFGIVGVILYVCFWVYILRKAFGFFRQTKSAKHMVIVLLIACFFGIEGVADSTFTTHRGFFILMFLGLTLSEMKYINNTNAKNEINESSANR